MPDGTALAHRRDALAGTLFCFSAAVLFSAKSILVKLVYVHPVDASTMLALRMAFSLPFFLSMMVWSSRSRQHRRLDRREWIAVAALGFVGYYLASYLDFLGLQYISASFERLTLFLYPTIVVLLSAMLFKRRMDRYQLLALVLSYTGIALVFIEHLNTSDVQHDVWLGASLVLASAVIYSVYLVGSAEVVGRIGAVRFTAYAMTVACVVTFLQFLLTHPLSALRLPHEVYALTLAMAVFSTVLPAALMSEGLRRIGANRAAMVGSIGPVSTIMLGYVFLGELLTEIQLAGAALVLAGVTLVTLKSKVTPG